MNAGTETTQVVDALERAIVDSRLPPRYSSMGQKLLCQLQTALRITFVGWQASGKTSLINMMVGQNALPSFPFGRVIDLEYGPVETTVLEYEDGTLSEHHGVFIETDRPDDVLKVTVQRPIEYLRFQTYSEIRLNERDASKDAFLHFIAQSSTITVWCSETFEEAEQTLWAEFPDHIKDHGFLALTMADRQIMKNALEGNLERISDFVSQEFFDVFPVAVLQALNARQDLTATGEELWDLSGGRLLFDAIHKQIALGREEDTDRARHLLQQIAEPSAFVSDRLASERRSKTAEGDRVSCSSEPTPEMSLGNAISALTTGAEKMLREADDLGAFDCSNVLETCLETLRDLAADLAKTQDITDGLVQLETDMQESENMLLLLKLEQNDEAALDAVSLLIQMKKEISRRIPN